MLAYLLAGIRSMLSKMHYSLPRRGSPGRWEIGRYGYLPYEIFIGWISGKQRTLAYPPNLYVYNPSS
jgi:hypothetical protein